jgi:recombination protein RecA
MAKKKTIKLTTNPKRTGTLADRLEQIVRTSWGKDTSFGVGFVAERLSSLPDCGVDSWLTTGSLLVDGVIQRPGIPEGKLTVIHGKPASGKTTLACHLIVEAVRVGWEVVIIDGEDKFDPSRLLRIAQAKGVEIDLNNITYARRCVLEQMFGLLIKTAKQAIGGMQKQKKGAADNTAKPKIIRPTLYIVDSHSSLPTYAEAELEDDEVKNQAWSARVTSHYLKRVIPLLGRARIALVFVCQPRQKIGMTAYAATGDTFLAESPIRHHAILILKTTHIQLLKKGDEPVGIVAEVKCTKSNISSPHHACQVYCYNQTGIDESVPLLNLALRLNLVGFGKGGVYHLVSDKTVAFRRETWWSILHEHPELLEPLTAAAYRWVGKEKKGKDGSDATEEKADGGEETKE